MMRKYWLLFSQVVTVLLAVYFVLVSLKPQWLARPGEAAVAVFEAPADSNKQAAGGGPGSLRAAAKAASGAVVSINASKVAARAQGKEDPWFRYFFGDQSRTEPQVGLGSGVIVSPSGYILTNNHVIAGADDIEVILNDSRKARAKVIGTDPETDLAILKIELDALPVGTLSASVRPSPVASSAPWAATSWASMCLKTLFKPTPPSTRAIPEVHWSTRRGVC